MYTAVDARTADEVDLDRRIKYAVENRAQDGGAYIRIYIEDKFNITEELTRRGFINIYVPDIVLKGDVYFEW